MGEDARLTAAKDRSGRFSGYYKCSLCEAAFRLNPKNLGELGITFAAHVKLSHPADKAARVDMNQAAARTIKEGR